MRIIETLKNEYRDSLYLMRLSADVSTWPGVVQAVIVMGTESNRRILEQVGFFGLQVQQASADNLLLALEMDEAVNPVELVERLRQRLSQPEMAPAGQKVFNSLQGAVEFDPAINLVSLSIPGEAALQAARQALEGGRSVFCFSHHVPVEDEIALKDLALQQGLWMLGPDCGTAVIDGVGLGFANAVRPGNIGVVSASGSGLQEVISLIHRAGGGISQAVGVGGRDLASPVDGRMAEAALRRVAALPQIQVLVLIGKKAGTFARQRLLKAAADTGLPLVTQLHLEDGGEAAAPSSPPVFKAATYEDVARLALALTGINWPGAGEEQASAWLDQALPAVPKGRCAVRGLFAGGSLCGEAAAILQEAGLQLQTNLQSPLQGEPVPGSHVLLDLGSEEYTEGRAHPFIDHRLRALEVEYAFADIRVGVILADVVLGWGCHEDPAGQFAQAVLRARAAHGAGPLVIAALCGTDLDPQGYEGQRQKLEAAGICVAGSNAAAARLGRDAAVRLAAAAPRVATSGGEKLLAGPVVLANYGMPLFEEGPASQGARVIPVRWQPGAKLSDETKKLLDQLL